VAPDKSSSRSKTTWRTLAVALAIAVAWVSGPAPTGPVGGGGNTGNDVSNLG
jgi:hypothetical protein